MNRLRKLQGPFVRIALLALLLAAQGLAVAHDLDHLGAHGDSPCAHCSSGHAQKAATLESQDLPTVRTEPVRFAPAAGTPVAAIHVGVFHARAPPRSR